jgi:hypothetical protein
MVQTAQRAAPFTYFFAGVEGEKPEAIPGAWHTRFYIEGARPFPGYPDAREFPPGCTTRHCDAGPGGGSGLLAAPYAMDLTRWTLQYPPATAPLVEVEVDHGVWLMVAPAFTPFDLLRSPVLAPLDIAKVHCITTKHTEPRHQWLVPCCLTRSELCVLPMVDHCERGAWRSVPRYEYARIATITDALAAGMTATGEPLTRDMIRAACCDGIAVNYEVTDIELGAMGILGDDFYNAVAEMLSGGRRPGAAHA